jgi:sulfur relay (sulfurtransferase) complex TusBCD TusD component (DsrE family)
MIGCSRCATARGYVLVTDGGENYFSNCTIPAVAIRNLEQIVERLRLPRPVLGITSIIQQAGQKVPADPFLPKRGSAAPPVPVTILITKSPYATEHTFGALSLAILAAHKEILTRVIFIEDGVYALYGSQFVHERDRIFNIQDIVTLAGEEGYMELYAFTPSFEQRGIEKNPRFERILDIGSHELGKLLFGQDFAPDGGQHRVFFF